MKKVDYTIIFVSDMSQSVAFYRDTLGFPLKFESPYWTEFGTEGSTLALHPETPKGREMGNPAGTCQPGFMVDDIEAFHRDMETKKVACVIPPTRQEFGGVLAVYKDLDGMAFTIMGR